ncbi:toll-like receptor 13 [Mantella aurantiaca]
MKLVYLNVSYNYLTNLEKGQFSCLKKLQILSLENNKINHIEDFAFDGLPKLEVLNLQNNNLFSITEFTFGNLFSLRRLNLYENKIDTFCEKAFQDLGNLIELQFSYDEWKDIYFWETILSSLTHLSANSPDVITEEFFYYNFPQLQVLEIDAPLPNLKCIDSQFSKVKELHFRNILSFNFHCGEKPWNPLLNFTNLEKLYYFANLQDYSDLTLANALKNAPLKFLYLQDTEKLIQYGRINVYEMFQGLSQLRVLHLRNSGIENLDSKDIFRDSDKLEILIIENQNIQEINETVFSWMPNLKYIHLLQTTFSCSCKFSGLLSWLESGTKVSINFPNQECQINQKSFNLVSFIHSNCHTDLDLIMFVVTFAFTVLFLCTSLFYESIWWYILYLIYTVKCLLNHRHQDGHIYEYDVFISYNTHNELWVTEKLLPNLEQNGPPFFRVCIHNRDFEVGRDIVENIMDSIYNSRWTVCVITRSYLQSNWCSLEMRMAMYRLLVESKDSLILVFLDRISKEELQHYHRLTKLLDKKTYLDWPSDESGQQLFWARLRKVIAKSGRRISIKES